MSNQDARVPRQVGAVEDPNVQKIIAYQGAMARGNVEVARKVFQADVVYRVPGDNALSGLYKGPDAVMGYLRRLMELTDGTHAITSMLWTVSRDAVALETVNHASRNGKHLE